LHFPEKAFQPGLFVARQTSAAQLTLHRDCGRLCRAIARHGGAIYKTLSDSLGRKKIDKTFVFLRPVDRRTVGAPRLTLTLGRLDNLNGATFVQTGMMPW